MSKPKLSPQAKSTLKAVNVLLAYYKGGHRTKALTRCPLCDAARDNECSVELGGVVDCKTCPWVIFRGYVCDDKIRIVRLRNDSPSYWCRLSIRRLTFWARLIKNGAYDRKLKEAKS